MAWAIGWDDVDDIGRSPTGNAAGAAPGMRARQVDADTP